MLKLFLHSIDIFDFNDLIHLPEPNSIRVDHLRLDFDHVIEVGDREVIRKRVPSLDFPVPAPFPEILVSPLAVPLLLALRRVLMYLLVYLARVEVSHCDRPVLRHTHQMPALLGVRSAGAPVSDEELSDGGGVV